MKIRCVRLSKLFVCIVLCIIAACFTASAHASLNSWESERFTSWNSFQNSSRYSLIDTSNSHLLSRLNVGLSIYKVGSTFTKGSTGPKVTPDGSGNVSLGASQCMGYAHWMFYVLYGQTPSGIKYSCLKSSTTYTADAIKNLVKNTGAGLGTHIRFNSGSSNSGHSVVLLGYDANGLVYLEANYNGSNGICVAYSTWSTFINGMKNKYGEVKYYVETPMIKSGGSSPSYATQYASTAITSNEIENNTIQVQLGESVNISYLSSISTKKDSNNLSLREGLYDGSWSSSNENICIVENVYDTDGNITGGRIIGVGTGTASVSVRTKLNLTASIQVTVSGQPYFSICQNNGLRYPTGFTVLTTSTGEISSLPVNPSSDVGKEYGSTYLTDTLPIGTALHVTEIIENHVPGHYWYHVEYGSIDGWFYSNCCDGNTRNMEFDTDSCLTYTNFSVPSSYSEGSNVIVTGEISVEQARIRSINLAFNTNNGSAYNEIREFNEPVSSVDLTDPDIDVLLHFSDLSTGEYTFGFAFNLWAPYVNSNHQLVTDWGVQFPTEKYYSFEVIRKPIIAKTITIPTGSTREKLNVLKNVFIEGWYWNHWTEDTIGDYTQYDYTIKYGRIPTGTPAISDGNPVYCGISTHPCNSGGVCDSDNRYWGYLHGGRGLGFARMIFDLLWDLDTERQSSIFVRRNSAYVDDTILEHLVIGDMVSISDNTNNVSFVITGVSKDYVSAVACNLNPNFTSLSNSTTGCYCQIDWNITISRDLLNNLAQDSSVKTFYVNIPDEDRDLTNVELSFDVPEIILFADVPFSSPDGWGHLNVAPESIRYEIDYENASSNTDCILTNSSGIWPNSPGSATISLSYGSATAAVYVRVLGRSDCLILPNRIKTIDEEAFYNDSSIKAVVLPDGIKRIESKAFANCNNLIKIWLPNSLEYIAPDAFSGCSNISLCMKLEEPGIAEAYAQQYGYPCDYYDP